MKRPSARAGFVLPSVIVVIAIMTLALWSATLVLEGLTRDLRQLRGLSRLELSAATAEARVGFLMMTEPLAPRGLRINAVRTSRGAEFGLEDPEIAAQEAPEEPMSDFWFDGRPYRLETGPDEAVLVRVQDQAGLINLNVGDPAMIQRLALAMGAREDKARELADALADFVDSDDLLRLNGAEAEEYRQAGLAPPANAPLVNAAQIRGVYGWAQALAAPAAQEIAGEFSIGRNGGPFNVNTAPESVLRVWLGVSARTARQIIAIRKDRPIGAVQEITGLLGVDYVPDAERIYTFPSERVRIRVSSADPLQADLFLESWLTMARATADRPFFLSPIAATTGAGRQGVLSTVSGARRDQDLGLQGAEPEGDIERFPLSARLSDPRAGRSAVPGR